MLIVSPCGGAARCGREPSNAHLCAASSTYNKLVERCFNYCIKDFRNNTMTKTEQQCVMRFGEKYLRYSQRTSMRFAEHQQRLQAKMQEDLMKQQAQ